LRVTFEHLAFVSVGPVNSEGQYQGEDQPQNLYNRDDNPENQNPTRILLPYGQKSIVTAILVDNGVVDSSCRFHFSSRLHALLDRGILATATHRYGVVVRTRSHRHHHLLFTDPISRRFGPAAMQLQQKKITPCPHLSSCTHFLLESVEELSATLVLVVFLVHGEFHGLFDLVLETVAVDVDPHTGRHFSHHDDQQQAEESCQGALALFQRAQYAENRHHDQQDGCDEDYYHGDHVVLSQG
jgi:hypothetical protein